MQLAEIADGSERDLPWLLISGFGAHRLLAKEVGLHVSRPARTKGPARAAARVPARRRHTLAICRRTGCAPRLADAFARGPQPTAVVRRYRSDPSPLVRNMQRQLAHGKMDAVLRGDFDLIAATRPNSRSLRPTSCSVHGSCA
jgi:hypothetical protein